MRIVPIILAAIVLSACWSPIYNERLSSSAVLSQRLYSLAIESRDIGPVNWNMGNSDGDYEFAPSNYSDLDSGLIVGRGTGNFYAAYYGKADDASPPQIGGSQGGSLGFAGRTVLVSVAVSAKYAAKFIRIGLNGETGTKADDLHFYYRDPTLSNNLVDAGSVVSPAVPTSAYLVAAGSVLDANGSADDIELLYWDPTSLTYQRYGITYDALPTPTLTQDGPYTVTGIGSTVNQGSGFFRLNNDFYLSAYSGPAGAESLHCYRWADSGSGVMATLSAAPVKPQSITAPIVGILSQDGLILAQDDFFLYAFNMDGSGVYKMPAGNLHFEQEFSVDGLPCAVFTQVISTWLNGQNSVAAKIWAVRSDAVRTIGK
ncbi:MAG: hypothetical protein ABSF43_00810 [Rectinemataceae bacterium]|jgi:hypothetical protein